MHAVSTNQISDILHFNDKPEKCLDAALSLHRRKKWSKEAEVIEKLPSLVKNILIVEDLIKRTKRRRLNNPFQQVKCYMEPFMDAKT